MKLMKLMFAGILVLSFAFAQDDNPCDPNMTYEVADPGPDGGCGDYADCNGNGAFDLGEPCFEQPPFDDVDANSDGKIDREEARAFWGDDPNFDQEFDDVDTDGSGDVDQAEFDAAGNDDGQDHDAMGDHDGQGAPDNHWDGNQDAICGGMDEYFLDENHDGELEGPYAVWYEGVDDDGNSFTVECYKDQGHDGGDHDGMTQLDHRIEGIKMFLNDMANNGVLASEDIDFLVNEAERLEEAVHSEWDGNDGAAGVVMGEIQAWLNDNVEDPGVRDHYLHELCMLEYEAHKEHGGSEGDPDCGPMDHQDGDMDHQDGDMDHQDGDKGPDAVADAFMDTFTGDNWEEAFTAAAETAKGRDQQEDDYDEAKWEECKEVGENAMNEAVANGAEDPQDVFGAIAMAVGACNGDMGPPPSQN